MSGIFGHLNLSDTDRVFNATIGQRAIYQAATDYINRVNADVAQAMSVFVGATTGDHKLRYKLPGGGYLQRRASDGRYGSVKAYGQWDVAFPLEDFGAQIASNDVDRAYMTVAELDRHISTVAAQNANTVRFEMLKAILNNTQDTFVDPLWGSLSVEPLANGDSVTYPPVLGSDTEATDDHYLESGYAASAISDTNNPYATIANELEEHFGAQTGGGNLVCFLNNAQTAKTKALPDFVSVADMGIRYGDDADLAATIPAPLVAPAVSWRVLGRIEGAGVWAVEWRHIPANYIVGVHLDAPAPLMRRIDPADTGLGDGLQLVATDEQYPFSGSFWRHRFGFGAGNRLNGVVMELGTGGSYSIPSGYS